MVGFAVDSSKRKRQNENKKAAANHGNEPEETPFIRLYANWLTAPKPTDKVGWILIHSTQQVDPDKLEQKLRKKKISCDVGVFMRQPEGNRNLLVLLKTPKEFGGVGDNIRKAIGELTA